jgi:tetratricopeptide (TPR) repeat protein
VDEEKALAAYESVLARDSLNAIALNNASVTLVKRGENEKVLEYLIRAAGQPGGSAIQFSNAIPAAVRLGRWETADSLTREFVRRFPTNPVALRAPAMLAVVRGEFDKGEQIAKEIEPRIRNSRGGMIQQGGFMGNLSQIRGRLRESFRYRADQRELQAQNNPNGPARLMAGMDSVLVTAVILDDQATARALLDRALKRAPIDSIPELDRDYGNFLFVAAMARDTARAREWHAASRRGWESAAKLIDRPAFEALDDASLAMAFGRWAEALAGVEKATRLPLERKDIPAAQRFLILDRLQQVDSAIAAGERYLAITIAQRPQQDALYLAGMRQRLGEMYEAKGNVDKALEHYTAFVDLWRNADPELQPRVRDVRGRIERLQRRRG